MEGGGGGGNPTRTSLGQTADGLIKSNGLFDAFDSQSASTRIEYVVKVPKLFHFGLVPRVLVLMDRSHGGCWLSSLTSPLLMASRYPLFHSIQTYTAPPLRATLCSMPGGGTRKEKWGRKKSRYKQKGEEGVGFFRSTEPVTDGGFHGERDEGAAGSCDTCRKFRRGTRWIRRGRSRHGVDARGGDGSIDAAARYTLPLTAGWAALKRTSSAGGGHGGAGHKGSSPCRPREA